MTGFVVGAVAGCIAARSVSSKKIDEMLSGKVDYLVVSLKDILYEV